MVDFIRGPGKILKYDPKRGKFHSPGPPFSVRAPVKITASPPLSTALLFYSMSHVFWHLIDDIFRSSGWILMQGSVLETLLVVDSMINISAKSLSNFIAKTWLQSWNLLKIGKVKSEFLEELQSFKLFVGTYITFLKGYDADYWMNTKLPMNYHFEKNICAGLVNMGGAAGEWLITDEFFTDLDKMGIFVLSKAQTFRICATFLDPAKFSNLVIHLITAKKIWLHKENFAMISQMLYCEIIVTFSMSVVLWEAIG